MKTQAVVNSVPGFHSGQPAGIENRALKSALIIKDAAEFYKWEVWSKLWSNVQPDLYKLNVT